jgi:hypothetical protein
MFTRAGLVQLKSCISLRPILIISNFGLCLQSDVFPLGISTDIQYEFLVSPSMLHVLC